MNFKKWFLFAWLFALLGLVSCGGSDDNGGGTEPDPPITYSLKVTSPSNKTLAFDAAGGNQSISFSASSSWSLSVASTGGSWCSASATSGTSGNKSVTITVSENTGATERSSSVTIKCGDQTESVNITQAAASVPPSTTFVKGADISWVTEMEAANIPFYNASGSKMDCFELMKSLGMNIIRLRVWVNPEKVYYGKWCDKDDVVAKAIRAKNAGLDVMIDFHYSDVFADPGNQTIPEAWKALGLNDLKSAVAEHTTDVLTALKDNGVTPAYIQIGNETRNGMLWPKGQLWTDNGDIKDGWSNYAALSNAGYDAAKAVFNDAIVLVHLNNAYEDLDWWFAKFKAAGGKFDMIGLSHYPQNAYEGKSKITPSKANELAVGHISSLSSTYNVKVMIVEIGVKPSESSSASIISSFMKAVKDNEKCAGVLYWEPEYYSSPKNEYWKPDYYTKKQWNSYDMGAFTDDGKPSSILDAFKD